MNTNTTTFRLLPHTQEQVYGLDRRSAQITGWEIEKFKIKDLWKYTTGKNTRIAILDTGCDKDHDDLKEAIVDGYNAITHNDNFNDDNGHGSHVAGTIAARNNGIGIVGVAPEASILAVKVLNHNGEGTSQNIAEGIVWAADNNSDIITMSLASPSPSTRVSRAINYATNKGCLVVCAAGNSGNESGIQYPAKLPSTIAIGSIGQNLNISPFTCLGPEIDFLSPGENIFSCGHKNNYIIMSGTSMATPFAVGCMSLLLSDLKNKTHNSKLSKQEIVRMLNNKSIKTTTQPIYRIVQPALYDL